MITSQKPAENHRIIFSRVEQSFLSRSNISRARSRIPFIVVDNVLRLGLLTALRFFEWVNENPEGTISMPTGKTPEYFIKWVQHLLQNWDDRQLEKLRKDNGLSLDKCPAFRGLHFVQMDEFYPIDPSHHNSLYSFVNRFYIQGFGLTGDRCQLLNCHEIPRPDGKPFDQIFPDNRIDLTLRHRDTTSSLEEVQKSAIYLVDQWCTEYEEKIRLAGGIGFFIGGIGPDGHIAFNVRGSDHNSTTRLTETNFETQAAAAADLGGIEVSRTRPVITIGLSTITHNPEATAVIMAAGEAKAEIVRASMESNENIEYPATVLSRLQGARFYITQGAAVRLDDFRMHSLTAEPWSEEKTERAIVNLCVKLNRFGHRITLDDLKNDKICAMIPDLDDQTVPQILASFEKKLERGLKFEDNQTFFHTGPHHDDIMLGYLPQIAHLVRSPLNRHHFCVLTSGFTSVTNGYVRQILSSTKEFLDQGLIQMIDYPDFFQMGYRYKRDKDVFHYLDRIASNNPEGRRRGLSHRVVRALVEIFAIDSRASLEKKIDEVLRYLDDCYDGEKNRPDVQQLKGMIREFEEELVWSHYGVQTKDISHLRLGFYTGDIFTESPERKRDVEPILEKLRSLKPTVITLALDPEGSGPDTHYKVLQAIAEAVRLWSEESDLSKLRIWGYRNVWYRFDAAEADIIVPVSLNSLAMLRDTFLTCYLSQKSASFPSHELDGPFCDLVQKIWVAQNQTLQLVLGRDFWYQNDHPRLRAAHGALFLRELTVEEFLSQARRLEQSIEGEV